MFIVVEGIDGSGKTTISRMLQEKLSTLLKPRRVVWHRAPEGPIRDLLLNRTTTIAPATEVLLFVACHQWLLTNHVIPALKAGHVVILDRFTDSTIAYQGAGREWGVGEVAAKIEEHITYGGFLADKTSFQPDHTIYVDVPQAISEARVQSRGNLDFMDKAGEAFRARVAKQMRILKNEHENHFLQGNSAMAVSQIRNETSVEALEVAVDAWITEHRASIDASTDNLIRRDLLSDLTK